MNTHDATHLERIDPETAKGRTVVLRFEDTEAVYRRALAVEVEGDTEAGWTLTVEDTEAPHWFYLPGETVEAEAVAR